jgi:hypothetical protein
MKSVVRAALFSSALISCVHFRPSPEGPEGVARAYADALEQGQVELAFQLSSGVELATFKACYADAKARTARVAEVRAAAGGAPAGGSTLRLAIDHGTWRVQELDPARPADSARAAEVLTQFLDDAEHGDFDAALKRLGPSLRARYSAQRFKDDFEREPLAKERLARARSALQGGAWVVLADGAQLALGGGKAVRLAKEGDAWRVVALE